MLVYDFIVVDTPFDRAWSDFASLPRNVVADALGASVGATPAEAVRRTPDRLRDDTVVIGFTWARPSATSGAVVHLEGELQCAPLDDGRTHLSLSGSYETAATPSSRASDRARAHREVEVRVRAFLHGLRGALHVEGTAEQPGS